MATDVARWLQLWDASGIHRTATAGDSAGAAWLAGEAASLGTDVSIESFRLSRLDPVDAWIECRGQRIAGVPVFDSPPTGPGGVEDGIGVVRLSPWTVYTQEYQTIRRAPGYAGLVIVCGGGEPGLALLNAEQYRAPYGCPALHVAAPPDAGPTRLVSHYQRTDADACNIVVTIPGHARERPPVVVMTPRSSWWQSVSERGGGLVCWLETLRMLVASPPACDVVMTANSGHELGHLGLDDFLARRPGWDNPGGAVWVHYGANIGAIGGALSVQSADEPLRACIRATLTEVGHEPNSMAPVDRVPSGETRDIHLAGGRYVTLVGTNRLFHLPQDRWPAAVDVAAIAKVAAGAAAMVHNLTR